MESFDFDNVKAEKASAMRRYNRLRSIARLFRLAELCAALLFLSWTFARLPFLLHISRDYFLLLSGVVSSPLFVFALCNAIVLALLAKSRHTMPPQNDDVQAQLYDQFIRREDRTIKSHSEKNAVSDEPVEELVYQDKQIVSETNTAAPKADSTDTTDADSDESNQSDSEFLPKVCRRTRSENFGRERPEKLRRSETENFRKIVRSAGEECLQENLSPQDSLSNEDFQRAIEDFIARQLRFRQEESLAVVLQNQS